MTKKYGWFLLIIEIGFLVLMVWRYQDKLKQIINPTTTSEISEIKPNIGETAVYENKITPTIVLVKTVTPTVKKKKIITPTPDNEPWGVAKQINEVTWTMKVGEDEKMATAKEIFEALNEYRRRYGSQVLTWDEKLGNYAQSRAIYLKSIKNVDKHEGFNNFVENESGFDKLGFTTLGENISYGYKLNGVHIIEWMYAGDEPHNNNQLDNRWNYVGIGVDGLATCLIFGTGKM
jgi:uncharacterized protein YkwD